jgi:hypothetical protein
LYGGGLTRGDKILQGAPDGLAYHNLGTFFAKQGFTTVIADYRRVNDSAQGTGEDAVFPSGGEDLSLVVKYLAESLGGSEGKRELYLMGNSAGGLHLSTFLLFPQFLSQRQDLLDGKAGLKLKGAILLSVPLDFDTAQALRLEMQSNYWPLSLSPDSAVCQKEGNSSSDLQPRALLASLEKGKQPKAQGIPPVLLVEGEFDPEDEILGSMKRFRDTWASTFGSGDGLETLVIAGHNHISPPIALMSEEKADEWGKQVATWCKKQI